MRVVISSVLLEQITAHADAAADEVCGLLFGTGEQVTGARACANVAADPARRFELDPAALIAAHRAARQGGPAMIGHYHSHPGGPAIPSARDAAESAADGALWLIVGNGEVRGWRAVANGLVAGRFDPVEVDAVRTPDGRAPRSERGRG